MKNISTQVILNSGKCLNTHEAILHTFHLNPTCFLGLGHPSLCLFLKWKMGVFYLSNCPQSCSEALTSPLYSYASLELRRQIRTAQNISPCSLVIPHSVAALNQNNDLFFLSLCRKGFNPINDCISLLTTPRILGSKGMM